MRNNPPMVGTKLASFEITKLLGKGGMGEVWLARDTKLDRDVAIKALPADLAMDPERRARFDREAKTLAQLNHSNVGGIYGVEEFEGASYLVLEYVEGETLAARLDRGALPVDEALDIAVQIAAGVEAAHDAGVIHRDLKPGNVIVTPDGQTKVLDFGLARTGESSTSSIGRGLANSPTITTPNIGQSPTLPGVILGTAAYMSPEQARGRRVDRQTDIWSFGVVLYELLTGVSPFVGETVSDSIGAVLHKDLNLDRLPPQTPANVRRVLELCIERNKSKRFRDIGDVRIELLAAEQPSAIESQVRSGWLLGGVVGVVLGLLLAATVFVPGIFAPANPPAEPQMFDLVVLDVPSSWVGLRPRVSPDGRAVAYVYNGQIAIRRLDTFESQILESTKGVMNLFWSPESDWIGYHSSSDIFKVPLRGGRPIKLNTTQVHEADHAGGGAWLPNGRLLICATFDGIVEVDQSGGSVETILELDRERLVDFHDVRPIAGSEVYLYIEHRVDQSYAIFARQGERVAKVVEFRGSNIADPVYIPSGHIVFTRHEMQNNIWAVPFDLDSLSTTGDPFLVLEQAAFPSLTLDGDLVFQRGTIALGDSLAIADDSGIVERIAVDVQDQFSPKMSPDGKRLAFTGGTSPNFDLWVYDLERKTSSRITFLETIIFPLAWSPDGKEIAALELQKGNTSFHAVDGSGQTREPLIGLGVYSFDDQWKSALAKGRSASSNSLHLIFLDDPSATDQPFPVRAKSRANSVAIRPGGALVAYTSDEGGKSQVFCMRYPDGPGKWQVSTAGGDGCHWSADGKTLFIGVDADSQIFAVDVSVEPEVRFGTPRLAFDGRPIGVSLLGGWTVSPDGKRFAMPGLPDSTRNNQSIVSIIKNWSLSMLETEQ